MNNNSNLYNLQPLLSYETDHKMCPPLWGMIVGHDTLRIRFQVQNHENYRLHYREKKQSERRDHLWLGSCAEFFITQDNQSYREFNFTWDHHWQCYDFTSYRVPASSPLPQVAPPIIETSADTLDVTLEKMPFCSFNIACILEDQQGQLSYHCLNIVQDKPDFHHLPSFSPKQ